MARPLRHHPKGSTLEITMRCTQRRFLLRPDPHLVLILQGILARALARYGIVLHHFFYASNHFHLIITIPHPQALALFMCYVNGNTAREASRIHGWSGPFWSGRYRSIEILDPEAQLERFKYVLSHGCKEGLVAHPTEWPGATGVHSLLSNDPVAGIWVDRTALYEARRFNPELTEDHFTEQTSFELTPLPIWSHLSFKQRKQRVETLIDEIVAEAEAENRKRDRTPMGSEAILRVDPHSSPAPKKPTPAPRAHFRDATAWHAFLRRMKLFMIEYREASYRYLRGEPDIIFPTDCFPPPLTFADPRNLALFPT